MESNLNNKENNSFQRATAIKINISVLNSGYFVQKEGFEPSYLDTVYGELSRINIIAVIISKSILDNSIEIEDKTGKISLRIGTINYSNINFDDFELGSIVNIIGKVRKYNDEIYIVPEILKKINDIKWVKVRELELKNLKKIKSEEDIKNTEIKQSINSEDVLDASLTNSSNRITIMKTNNSMDNNFNKNNIISSNISYDKNNDDNSKNPDFISIINTIKKLDHGDGADSNEIIKESQISNGEDVIKKLLEVGEIFEIRPGKIKVLE